MNAFKYKIEYYIIQLQKNVLKSIIFEFFALTSIQRNYDIYKRKLLIIVRFIEKYSIMFNATKSSII